MVSNKTTYHRDGCRKIIETLRMRGSINMSQLAFETGMVLTLPECIHVLKELGLVGEKLIGGRRVFDLYSTSHETMAEVMSETPIRVM